MIGVHEIALLFLCKTATKKTLCIKANLLVCLHCEIDDKTQQTFFTECESNKNAKELEKQCVEWLNY